MSSATILLSAFREGQFNIYVVGFLYFQSKGPFHITPTDIQEKYLSLIREFFNKGKLQRIIYRDYYMAIFILYPVSTRDTHINPRAKHPRANMGLGLIWGMIWKLPYHNLFIIHFSFWQVCLFDIVCGVKGKTAECSECGDMGFLPVQKSRITHLTQKSSITHMIHYHTFCAPQEWYVLDSHFSITYAKWTYFLVNVW